MKNIKCNKSCFKKKQTIFHGKIRSGTYPLKSKKKFRVIKCLKCNLVKLSPFPKISYETKQYRNLYNQGLKKKNYLKFSNVDQKPEFFSINRKLFSNKVVLDYGCGYGFFLDNIKKKAKKTLAIEPQKNFQDLIKSKGHQIVDHKLPDVKYLNSVDVVTSFGVIEHINNPLNYLKLAFKLLKKNGIFYVCTDNFEDILMQVNLKEFNEFYFRTAHSWYFNNSSLRNLLLKSGFKILETRFIHNHGVNNFIHWLENKKPLNDNKKKKNLLDKKWIKTLENSGRAELILFKCKKKS